MPHGLQNPKWPLNKFFYPSTPSMRKGRDGGGKKKKKEKIKDG